MPLVSSKKVLEYAQEARFAVGAFNADNLEMVQAIVEAAQEERAPVILQVSQGAIRYAGLALAAGMVRIAAAQVDVPVVLHLDHGTSFEQNVRCLREGFTSLMFDGSKLPYEENMAQTAKIVEIAHIAGIPVEAELGKVLQAGATPQEVEEAMTDPHQALDFVQRTGCDSLAVAVGSIHAMKGREAELDIDRVRAISDKVGIPLVLHGSSGVKHDSVLAAIENGVCKVNVATYLKQGFVAEMCAAIDAMPDEVDFRKFLAPAREAAKERVREKMRLLGSSNRISSSGAFRSPPIQQRSVELGGAEE